MPAASVLDRGGLRANAGAREAAGGKKGKLVGKKVREWAPARRIKERKRCRACSTQDVGGFRVDWDFPRLKEKFCLT
jgi:hypothetical protein